MMVILDKLWGTLASVNPLPVRADLSIVALAKIDEGKIKADLRRLVYRSFSEGRAVISIICFNRLFNLRKGVRLTLKQYVAI